LHMAQLMPLPLTVSCFSKIQIGFTFLVLAHLGSPGQRAVKRVCVCNTELQSNLPKSIPLKPITRCQSTEGHKGKGSPYSITGHRVPELISVLGSQPAGDVSHKPGGRLPLLSTRPVVTAATLKRAATSFVAW